MCLSLFILDIGHQILVIQTNFTFWGCSIVCDADLERDGSPYFPKIWNYCEPLDL